MIQNAIRRLRGLVKDKPEPHAHTSPIPIEGGLYLIEEPGALAKAMEFPNNHPEWLAGHPVITARFVSHPYQIQQWVKDFVRKSRDPLAPVVGRKIRIVIELENVVPVEVVTTSETCFTELRASQISTAYIEEIK